jgi:hypothetical protein
VATLAEIEEGLAGQLAMLDRHRLNGDACAAEKALCLAHPVRSKLALGNHRTLDVARHAQAASFRIVDDLREGSRFGVAVENSVGFARAV